eukprot:3865930-Rhodomonas_salina.3
MVHTDDLLVTTSAAAAAIRKDLVAFACHLRHDNQRMLRDEVLIHLPGKHTWVGKNIVWVMNSPLEHCKTICKWVWEWMTELEQSVAKTVPDWETRMWDCAEMALVHLCPTPSQDEVQYQMNKPSLSGGRGRGGARGGRGRGTGERETRETDQPLNQGGGYNDQFRMPEDE